MEKNMKFMSNKRYIDTDNIASRLNQVMIEQGLSQYDVSRATGLTRAMVGHLCTGKRGFRVETCTVICKALDIDIIWFITGLKDK